jgi:hypothetical protein
MSNTTASASAISLNVDDFSRGDIGYASTPDGSTGASWPIKDATCFDSGAGKKDLDVDGSTVTCDSKTNLAEAKSVAAKSTVDDQATQGGTVTTKASLDPVKGVVATVTSTARGISLLGGALSIGEVKATAKAWAKGRPGTAKSEFDRTVSNVVLNGVKLCDAQCDLKELSKQVNTSLAGRARIDFPEPDAVTSVRGSKGGFQAIIQRDPFEQLEQQQLNEQRSDRLEVPGLVVTAFEDVSRPARTIYEFAGTEAEARYAISLVGGDGGGLGTDGPVFGLTDVGLPGLPGGGGDIGPFSPGTNGPAGPGTQGDALGGSGPVGRAGRLLLNGIRRILQLFPIWAILLAPVYLSARRWLLFQRSSLISGVGK